ncbi:hypothetical protein [Siansivirga zeaxanthinifaciens]|nr:hypothetical protein [Siansivirga zeaxanthinifaciens]
MSFSQVKNEKEERIEASEFPENAIVYFNTIENKVKYLKFYKETDGSKSSYEAKFKLNKLIYSIEFDSLGKLEDIEIVINIKQIPETVLKNIMAYFNTEYKKIKFIKIQKQYINTIEKSDPEFINYVINSPNAINTHFEIIAEIETKEERTRVQKEFTFKNTGTFEKSRPVSSSSYDYVLY